MRTDGAIDRFVQSGGAESLEMQAELGDTPGFEAFCSETKCST